jgi:hypothetical protein
MNTDYTLRGGFGVLLLVTGFTGLMACCQEATARSEDWEFNLAPYFWAPDVDLDLRLGPNQQPFDEGFLQRDGSFKPNVGGAVLNTFYKGWVFSLAGEAMDADTEIDLEDGRPGEFEFQRQQADGAVGYEFTFTPYEGSSVVVFPLVGVRYRHLTLRLVDLYPPPEVDEQGKEKKPPGDGKLSLEKGSSHWFEPMAALQAQWFITPKISLAAVGDVDGFVGNNISWNALGWVKWHWTKEFSISLGYRYNEFDFSGGSGNRAWEAEGSSTGPMIGLELDFRGEPVAPGTDWTGTIGTTPLDLPEAPPPPDLEPPPAAEEDDPVTQGEDGNWFTRWLDAGHSYLNQKLDAGVEYADQLLKKEEAPMLQREKSRFYIELHTRFAEVNSGDSFELKPSVKVDLKVPNLKRQVKLFVTNQSVDQQRGTDVFDEDDGLNIGLETQGLFLKKTRFSVGVRNAVDIFVVGAWKPEYNHNRFRLLPEVRAYYRADKGGGIIFSALGIYRIRDRFRAGYLPSIEYREDLQAWEWIQSLAGTYIFEGNDRDYHRAFMSRFAARGTIEQGSLSYLLIPLYYRQPLYKKWLYWELGPEVVWKKVDRWEPEPGVRFAITSFFWGTEER